MFILDCTGSMCKWIKAVKNEIMSIIDCTMNQFFGIEIRVAIVGYRDFGDKDRYEIFDFSTDYDAALYFLDKIIDKGGSDIPEDLAGAFDKALN